MKLPVDIQKWIHQHGERDTVIDFFWITQHNIHIISLDIRRIHTREKEISQTHSTVSK